MPQFDFFSFFVQVFWLSIGLSSFFLVFLKFFLTKNFFVFKLREKFFNNTISTKKISKNFLNNKILKF